MLTESVGPTTVYIRPYHTTNLTVHTQAAHFERMSPQSLISPILILTIFPSFTTSSLYERHRIQLFQNLLKVTFLINLQVPLCACYPSQARKSDPSPLKQQLFEEHLPSLLRRSFKRRYKVANDRQKVEQEVGWYDLNMSMKINFENLIFKKSVKVLARLAWIKDGLVSAIATRFPSASNLQREQLLTVLAGRVSWSIHFYSVLALTGALYAMMLY